jgi:hypothetical protein
MRRGVARHRVIAMQSGPLFPAGAALRVGYRPGWGRHPMATARGAAMTAGILGDRSPAPAHQSERALQRPLDGAVRRVPGLP